MTDFACTFCGAPRARTSGLIVVRKDACICRDCTKRFFLEMVKLEMSGAQFVVLPEADPPTASLIERAADKEPPPSAA